MASETTQRRPTKAQISMWDANLVTIDQLKNTLSKPSPPNRNKRDWNQMKPLIKNHGNVDVEENNDDDSDSGDDDSSHGSKGKSVKKITRCTTVNIVGIGFLILLNFMLLNRRFHVLVRLRGMYVVSGGAATDFALEMPDLLDQEEKLIDHESIVSASNTTVIVSTNFRGGFPDPEQLRKSMLTLERLKGLPLDTTPIIINIDGPPEGTRNEMKQKNWIDAEKQLNDWYVEPKTNHTPFGLTNVQVLPSDEYLGFNIGLKRAIDLVRTEFVYVLYQQFSFDRDIDHLNLIQSMAEHPNTLRCIKFRTREAKMRRNPLSKCKQGEFKNNPFRTYNGLDFVQTTNFFDGNQLTTKKYYDEILNALGPHDRGTIADPMMKVSSSNCSFWGQTILGRNRKDVQLVWTH